MGIAGTDIKFELKCFILWLCKGDRIEQWWHDVYFYFMRFIITMLYGIQMRSSNENSVCLSVCLSKVCIV